MRKIENKNKESFDIIREYVSGDNPDIVLNDVQQDQLKRWNFYINLKLQGELKTRDIVDKMMKEFGVQRATCFNDMGYAEALFGYNASLNKRFRIGARIEFIEEKIAHFYKDDNLDVESAVKLEGILQKYYDIYPEIKQSKSPRTINYNLTKNEYNVDELPEVDDAYELLQKHIKE